MSSTTEDASDHCGTRNVRERTARTRESRPKWKTEGRVYGLLAARTRPHEDVLGRGVGSNLVTDQRETHIIREEVSGSQSMVESVGGVDPGLRCSPLGAPT